MAVGPTLPGTGQALENALNTIRTGFLVLYDEIGVCRKAATSNPLGPHEGASKSLVNYERLVSNTLNEGVPFAQAQAVRDANTTFSPAEAGLKVALPRTTIRRVADPNLLKTLARIMANAYNLKEDADGTAQFTSWPNIGAAGTVLGPGHVAAASARLGMGNDRTNPEPWPDPWYYIEHPLKLSVIAHRIVPLTDVPSGTSVYTGLAAGATVGPGFGGGSMAEEILRKGPRALGMLENAYVYRDANISVDSSDDASGAFFAKLGFYYIPEFTPDMVWEQDPDLRGVVGYLSGSYAWGIYRSSNSGFEMLGDASQPTT